MTTLPTQKYNFNRFTKEEFYKQFPVYYTIKDIIHMIHNDYVNETNMPFIIKYINFNDKSQIKEIIGYIDSKIKLYKKDMMEIKKIHSDLNAYEEMLKYVNVDIENLTKFKLALNDNKTNAKSVGGKGRRKSQKKHKSHNNNDLDPMVI
jgi:hypothetical protein